MQNRRGGENGELACTETIGEVKRCAVIARSPNPGTPEADGQARPSRYLAKWKGRADGDAGAVADALLPDVEVSQALESATASVLQKREAVV